MLRHVAPQTQRSAALAPQAVGPARTLLQLTLVACFVLGAGTSQRVKPAPSPAKVEVSATPLGPLPPCAEAGPVEVHRGALPGGAVAVVQLRLRADPAIAMRDVERALQRAAEDACCDGVSLKTAVANEGATGFTEAEAIGFSLWPPVASPPT